MNEKQFDVKKVLNEQEIKSLERLASDETTLNAVKKMLLFGMYYNGTMEAGKEPNPLLNFALQIDVSNSITDESLGRLLRAKTEGIVAVELGFKEIEKFKVIASPVKVATNRGK